MNGNITHGIYGMTINAGTGGSSDGITMNGNHFSALSEKGMYFEQLSHASLAGNDFNDVGNYGRGAAFRAGDARWRFWRGDRHQFEVRPH